MVFLRRRNPAGGYAPGRTGGPVPCRRTSRAQSPLRPPVRARRWSAAHRRRPGRPGARLGHHAPRGAAGRQDQRRPGQPRPADRSASARTWRPRPARTRPPWRRRARCSTPRRSPRSAAGGRSPRTSAPDSRSAACTTEFMRSAPHRANILAPAMRQVGVGIVSVDGTAVGHRGVPPARRVTAPWPGRAVDSAPGPAPRCRGRRRPTGRSPSSERGPAMAKDQYIQRLKTVPAVRLVVQEGARPAARPGRPPALPGPVPRRPRGRRG